MHSRMVPSELGWNPLPVTLTLCMATRPLSGRTVSEATDFAIEVEVVEVDGAELFDEPLEHAASPTPATTAARIIAPHFVWSPMLPPSGCNHLRPAATSFVLLRGGPATCDDVEAATEHGVGWLPVVDHYQVSVTAATAADANRLGRMAVEGRLAACAQVWGPIVSTYWWDGEVTSADEWVCALKTTSRLVEPLTEALRASHSYEVPEIIATPIATGNPAYLAWIEDETRSGGQMPRS